MVTFTQVKAYLNIPDHDIEHNTLISNIVSYVEGWLVGYLGQELDTTAEIDIFRLGRTSKEYQIRKFPVQSVSKLEYRNNPLDNWTTISSDDYTSYQINGVYKLYYDNSFSSSADYRVTYTYGYDTWPDEVLLTALEMCSVIYNESGHGKGILSIDTMGESFNGTSQTTRFKDLYNRWTRLLRKYRAVNVV